MPYLEMRSFITRLNVRTISLVTAQFISASVSAIIVSITHPTLVDTFVVGAFEFG
jgi:hypothetical protein